MRLLPLAAAVATALAAPVAVQAQGLSFSGVVSADHVHSGGAGRSLGYVDLTLGVNPGADGGFGFEAGVWGFAGSPGIAGQSMGFAAVTYGLGGGRLHVGAPRRGAHGFNTNPVTTGAVAALAETGIASGHVPFSTVISATNRAPIIGLRYDRESGPLRYAVSLGRMIDTPAVNVVSVGMAHQGANARVFGTLEHFWNAGGDVTVATVGGSVRVSDRVEVGGSLMHNTTGAGTTFVSAFATAQVTDRLSVTASALGRSGTRIVALNAGYEVWNGVVLNAGVGHTSGVGSLWTVGLSRRF